MKRLLFVAAAVATLLVLLAPAALAAGPVAATGDLILSVNGGVAVPVDTQVKTVIVIDGDASVSGNVDTLIVTGGRATLSGATVRNLTVIDGSAELQAGTTVSGDVSTIRATVTQQPGAVVQGSVKALDADLAALGLLLIPFLILLFLGFGLVAVAAALLVAALGARQVREVEALISERPGPALVAGIAGMVGLPLLAILLMVTVIGAQIGLALLFLVWPALAFSAWLVAAIWIGDWLVTRRRGSPEPGRPYRAAVLGVVVLAIAGLLPFVTAIATLFGLGAVLLAAWRILRPAAPPLAQAGSTQPAPSAS